MHTNERAAEAARQIDARGIHIWYKYCFLTMKSTKPSTEKGRYLIAHELTHVVQQTGERVNDETQVVGNKSVGQVSKGITKPQNVIQRQGHTRRNVLNLIPVGRLVPVGDASPEYIYNPGGSNTYVDEAGLEWELFPDELNVYHQPEGHEESDNPNPNKKFVHVDSSGGSSEAIMRPDGTFITTGPLQGTYNYSHPEGFWGYVRHFFQDVLPHVFNEDYENVQGRDPEQL